MITTLEHRQEVEGEEDVRAESRPSKPGAAAASKASEAKTCNVGSGATIQVTARAGTKQKERPFPDQKAKAKTGQDLGPPTAADDKRSNVIPIRCTVQQLTISANVNQCQTMPKFLPLLV